MHWINDKANFSHAIHLPVTIFSQCISHLLHKTAVCSFANRYPRVHRDSVFMFFVDVKFTFFGSGDFLFSLWLWDQILHLEQRAHWQAFALAVQLSNQIALDIRKEYVNSPINTGNKHNRSTSNRTYFDLHILFLR